MLPRIKGYLERLSDSGACRIDDTLRGLSVSGASAVFSCSGLRIHKTRFRLHTARVSSRQHGGQGLLLPERGHTGRHKAKGGGYYSPLRFRSWWAHMCKVCPRAALGSGDFPCKWHFDIKMRCLLHRRHRRRSWLNSKHISIFSIPPHLSQYTIPPVSPFSLAITLSSSNTIHTNVAEIRLTVVDW